MGLLDDGNYRLFDSKVFERGRAYYDAGRVDPPTEVAEGLWHAVVRGTDDYQVDVRLRHGKMVSAACTCPYGQRVTYCKHVAGVLIALDARFRDDAGAEPAFPRDASNLVGWYLMREFPPRKKLGDVDWRTIRLLLERLYDLQDFEGMLFREETKSRDSRGGAGEDPVPGEESSRQERRRERNRARENDYESRTRTMNEEREDRYRKRARDSRNREERPMNVRLLVPGMMPTRLNELPHVWLTLLEAAYEHLHDARGLRRLYAYYILIAQTDAEAVYVERLRRVSGRHWNEDRDMIVEMHRHRDWKSCWSPVNPAYERLLREERLSDAALRYTGLKSTDVLVRMLDVVALDPKNAQQAKQRLSDALHDPDSVIYESDDRESVRRVGRWIRKIETVFGFEEASSISGDIVGIFPHRTMLRNELSEYLAADGVEPPESDMEKRSGDDDE